MVHVGDRKKPITVDRKSGRLIRLNRRGIAVLDPGRLDSMGGIANRIAIDAKGRPWVVATTNDLYRREGNIWKRLPGKLSDIAIGKNGAVWGLAAKRKYGGYPVLKLNGASWKDTGATARDLAVDGSGNAWILAMADKSARTYSIYRSQNTGWKKMPEIHGPLQIASDHEGAIWVNGADMKYKKYRTLYKWKSTWNPVHHINAGRMAFTLNGNPIFPAFYIADKVPLKRGGGGWAYTPDLGVVDFTIDKNDVVWAIRDSKPLRSAGQAREILKWDGKQFEVGVKTRKLWESDVKVGVSDLPVDIAIDQTGSPWILGADYHLYRRANNAWVEADNRRLTNIISSPKGDIWAIGEHSQSVKYRKKRRNSPRYGQYVFRLENGKLKQVGKERPYIYKVAIDRNRSEEHTSELQSH